ncbi:hypothetical protein [Alkalibaculum bacchi]|uniref:hypothetical protein n=1 Tax=Alkalibaculum bacchi TaxID=645887 RepID=UPI0026EC39DD|nr:hypothetical protein [Alkalibaculum bacchi]
MKNTIRPLSGRGKEIKYKIENGNFKVQWGNLRFTIKRTQVEDILNFFFINSDKWYSLGASFDNPSKGGLGEYIQKFKFSPRHASAIATIMVNEELIEHKGCKPIELRKYNMKKY